MVKTWEEKGFEVELAETQEGLEFMVENSWNWEGVETEEYWAEEEV